VSHSAIVLLRLPQHPSLTAVTWTAAFVRSPLTVVARVGSAWPVAAPKAATMILAPT